MKRPLEWHDNCLRNMWRSVADAERAAQSANDYANRIRAEAEHLAAQIAEAHRRGLPEFDSERLLKKRKPIELENAR